MRRDTRETVKSFDLVLDIVLTTENTPSLAAGYATQTAVRSKFMANAWLTKHSTAWLRATEPTVSERGWHVHDHLLLFLKTNNPADLAALGAQTVERWLDSAHRAGVAAMPQGQHFEIHTDTRERLRYVTKGFMAQKRKRREGDGYSVGDVLAMYQAGEVEAAEWWAELEAYFLTRHRWFAKGGEAFRQSPASALENG